MLAAVTFTLITLLFLDLTGSLHAWLGWLAKIQFWPAVLALNVAVVAGLLILTLIFGRIYCSVICPLGIMQDIISALHGIRKRNRFSFSPEKRWLRYGVLVVFLASCVAGINVIVSLLAPYSSYGRMVNSILRPVWTTGNNVLASLAERMDSYAFYSVDVWMRSLPTLIIAAVTFVIIAVLAWRGGRTYCNTICPVGTILSFFARFSWFKISIDGDKCISCRLCEKNCTACQLCVSACPNDVLRPSSDLSKLMQPTMSYERGYCRPECTRCSDVCPTGAIKPITREDKSATQIGHAVWIKKNCVSVTDGVACGNCARHCPVGAITMIPLHPGTDSKLTIPAVNEARCIGCGACENLCPARPFSAIYVEGHEVHRTV